MRPPPKSKSKSEPAGSKSESKALVVFREDTVDEGDQPKPLNLYDPSEIRLRKSPTPNPIPTEVEPRNVARKCRSMGPEMCQSGSPRLYIGGNDNAETDLCELADSPARNSGVEFTRRSPTYASPVVGSSGCHGSGNAETILSELADSSVKKESEKVKSDFANCVWRNLNAEFVRRSPRFATPVIAAENGKSMFDFVRVRVRNFHFSFASFCLLSFAFCFGFGYLFIIM